MLLLPVLLPLLLEVLMTYKPSKEVMDILMPLSRKLGIPPWEVLDMLVKQTVNT